MLQEDIRPLNTNGQEKKLQSQSSLHEKFADTNIDYKNNQSKISKPSPGIEKQLEQLTLFHDEINKIILTENDLKELINNNSKTKMQKFTEKVRKLFSGIGINTNNKKHIIRIINICMIPPLYSHTLAIGSIFKDDRDTRILFFAYLGGLFFAVLFEFTEHVIGKFKHRPTAHIGSGIIAICSYILSMLGWSGLYAMESDVSIFGINFPFGIKHILANILSILPPLAIYAFTSQLFILEQEEEKKKEDKLKSGEPKKPYKRVKRFTSDQIQNFLYHLMANPNLSHTEFSLTYPDVGSSKFDQIKATARRKLREHQTNKQKKK